LIWRSAAIFITDEIQENVEREEQEKEQEYTFTCGATVAVVQLMPGIPKLDQHPVTNLM
jgi:hypothetical protein